jgi:hypothetical protein
MQEVSSRVGDKRREGRVSWSRERFKVCVPCVPGRAELRFERVRTSFLIFPERLRLSASCLEASRPNQGGVHHLIEAPISVKSTRQ